MRSTRKKLLPPPSPPPPKAAADIVAVPNVFAVAKDNVANVAAAREPKPTTCDVSTVITVDNVSPADVASVTEAVVAAGVLPSAGSSDVPDKFAVV
jgi:uncharacterized protein YunC (DUF1805 family)